MNFAQRVNALRPYGFECFPLKPDAKFPPLVEDWPKKATTDAGRIEKWSKRCPNANAGAHCKGLIVLDDDSGTALAEFEAKHGKLPATLTSITASGKKHPIFKLPKGHAGVPNSVGKLGPKLDVRSTGGYIVAPGSVVNSKPYRFEDETVPIAEAPAWLIELCGRATAKAEHVAPVPDADDTALERARDWLAKQPPAIQGEGGDAHTFTVACGLRDLGVSESQCVELMAGDFNQRCVPPWPLSELETKARNAYRYASNAPAAKVALPTDFDAVAPQPEAKAEQRQPEAWRIPSMAELLVRQGARRPYLVKGVLTANAHALLYGAPGEGKSFIGLDLAHAIASGRSDWHGHKLKQGPVLYLVYEGAGGIADRLKALEQMHGPAPDLYLATDCARYRLCESAGRKALAADIAATFGERPPVLIVVDTLARVLSLSGKDENSAQDMGLVNDAVAQLAARTGGTVLLIHHAGKDRGRGARGSSALLGALDTEMEVDSRHVEATKQRDMEEGRVLDFELEPVAVGMDEDGDIVQSCVVRAGAPAEKRWKPTKLAAYLLKAMCTLAPDNRPLTREELKPAFAALAYPTGETPEATERLGFKDAVAALQEHAVIEGAKGGPWARVLK